MTKTNWDRGLTPASQFRDTGVPASAPMARKQNEHEVLDFMLKYHKLCVILFRDNYSF